MARRVNAGRRPPLSGGSPSLVSASDGAAPSNRFQGRRLPPGVNLWNRESTTPRLRKGRAGLDLLFLMNTRTTFPLALAFGLAFALGACAGDPQPEPATPEPARDRTGARVRMIETLLAEGQIEAVREQFARLAEDPEARVSAGHVPSWTDDLVEDLIRRRALDLADSLLGEMGPVEARGAERQILTANLRVLQGRIDDAIAIYSGVEADDPAVQVRALHELATLQMRLGQWDAAIDRAAEALVLDPDRGPLRVLIARAEVGRGRPEAGLEALTALPPSPARWMAEAEIQFDSFDRPDTAVTLLMAAREQMPRDSGLALLLGRALIARGDPGAAIPFVEPLARRIEPYANSEEVLLAAWEGVGRAALADSLRAVLDARERADEVRALRIEGLRRSQSGELDAALEFFDRALALAPDDGELHHDRGVVLARQEKWTPARRALEAAARLRPDDVSVLVNLARLFDRTGRVAARDSIMARVRTLAPR